MKPESKTAPSELVNSNGKEIRNPCDIANEFNKYFSSIGPKMAEQFPYSNILPHLLQQCDNSFFLHETSVEEVQHLISNLKEGKALQQSDIPTKFLKMATSVVAPYLVRIYNCCMIEGVYPNELKIAQVIPVFKSGNTHLCSNYRPISILSQLNKIFEKVLHARVYSYLQEFNLLSPHQYGFRPQSSTALAVENICSQLYQSSDSGLYTCSLFIDLSKAFDTVNHAILLDKMEYSFGIKGGALKLFSNYLSNR